MYTLLTTLLNANANHSLNERK